MIGDKASDKDKKPKEEYHQAEQHQVEILKTSKATNNTNPLHGDLSEKPKDENTAVRDQDNDQ